MSAWEVLNKVDSFSARCLSRMAMGHRGVAGAVSSSGLLLGPSAKVGLVSMVIASSPRTDIFDINEFWGKEIEEGEAVPRRRGIRSGRSRNGSAAQTTNCDGVHERRTRRCSLCGLAQRPVPQSGRVEAGTTNIPSSQALVEPTPPLGPWCWWLASKPCRKRAKRGKTKPTASTASITSVMGDRKE